MLSIVHFIDEVERDIPGTKEYLWALPYACVMGCVGGLVLSLFSVFSLYYNYRKTILRVIEEGPDSAFLLSIWSVSSHHSLFFPRTLHPVQFMTHIIYFYALFSYILIIFLFILLSSWFYTLIYTFLKDHPFWLPLFLIPTAIKLLYLPRLAYRPTGEIRHKVYFAFWDFLQATFGIGLGLIRGLVRYLLGFGLMVAFAYRSHRSVYSEKMRDYDALYTSFCGLVVLHCLRLGIEPKNRDSWSQKAEFGESRQVSGRSNTTIQADFE